ncbi:hypothetical protein NGI12_23880 [Raoultella terrigena]|uniref:DDRRRQL repeat protein YjdP n=1 Tax=Raoultella terrigena TaxID=577 RepID=UPI002DBC5376|nr:DDRRRQL repeat protein YjdP [Raoultella terrigena]MEB8196492.1 hypothetical protein [Raoultella terrigena]
MKRYLTALILCTLSLSSQLAHADLIDDAIGNIQQAISDAYRPGDSRSDDDDRYNDSRDDDGRYQGSRQQSSDRQRQYDDRRRQLDDRQRQLDQDRRQLENDRRRLDDDY